MTRHLILGGAGFIGSHMTSFLKDKGDWVRVVDIKFPEYRKELWGKADEVVDYDLRYWTSEGFPEKETRTIADLFKEIDYVWVYSADMGGVGYFFSDADGKASADNMQIDLNVLRALQPGQRLFYASSFCAYPIKDQVLVNGKSKRAMTEEDFGGAPVEQIYGDEKRMMTILLEDKRKQGFDTRVGLFSTIFGPYQEIEDEKRSKFPTAIIKKVSKGNPIEIWGDGTQVRTFLYIDDFLEKVYRVMSADTYEGPVNIGSDEEVSVKEMADYACELAGVTPKYSFNLEKPTGVMGKQVSNEKFNRLYGEVPQTPTREGFKNLYEWYKPLVN